MKQIIKQGLRKSGLIGKKPHRWLNYPKVIQVDTTNICGKPLGLMCVYCFPQHQIATNKRKHQIMPTYEIEWIIDEMSRDGKTMGEVRWFLNGDATTDQRLPDIYRLSKKKCPWLKTNNFTNGVLYEKRDMLVDKNLDEIAFTISAHTPELYRLVHRGDRFEDVIRTLEWVVENRHKHQRVEVHMVLTKYNYMWATEWWDYFGKYDVHRVLSPLVASIDNTPSKQALGDLTLDQQERLVIGVAGERGRMWTRELIGDGKPCVLWDNLSIDCSGAFLNCCNWADIAKWNYGYVNECMKEDRTIREVWMERLANRMRNRVCRGCNMKHPNWKARLDSMQLMANLHD